MSMDIDTLRAELAVFGYEMPEDIGGEELDKLQELCETYGLSESGLSDEWVAYAASHKDHCEFSITQLNLFAGHMDKRVKRRQAMAKKLNKPDISNENDDTINSFAANDVLSLYGVEATEMKMTPLREVKPVEEWTPTDSQNLHTSDVSQAGPLKEILSFGNIDSFECKGGSTCLVPTTWQDNVNCTYKYMFVKVPHIAQAVSDKIDDVTSWIMEERKVDEIVPLNMIVQDSTHVGGLVFTQDVKLSGLGVCLQGSLDTSGGRLVPVDVSHLAEYSMFPGQITVFEGNNPTGESFVARQQLTGALPLLEPPKISPEFPLLDIVSVCGPFMQSDNLSFQPLMDFLNQCSINKPHVIILVGPFVDCKHPSISKCQVKVGFDTLWGQALSIICHFANDNPCTRILVVASGRDAFHHNVYPTPQYNTPTGVTLPQNCHLVPDPFLSSVAGVSIACTAIDILKHISAEEISRSDVTAQDRISRLVSHLFQQRSLYPLNPPPEGVAVDQSQLNHWAKLEKRPHLLVTPSDLKPFVKEVDQVLCVNPGKLVKGGRVSTYCRIIMHLGDVHGPTICKNVNAQVLNIN